MSTAATTTPPSTARALGDATVLPRRTVRLHGSRVAYVDEGTGPVVVLLHGITSSAATWNAVAPDLARTNRVIVPDLPGHGGSTRARGEYSISGFALFVRDLLYALDIDRATVVGHSLGGGVAMQLLYTNPEQVSRLVLVASGGLGRDVGLPLRLATLPGAELVLPVLCNRHLSGPVNALAQVLQPFLPAELLELRQSYATLSHPAARRAFLSTVRGAIDWQGQRIDATARLHLADRVPSLMVWGDQDLMIPIHHGRRAAEANDRTRFVAFPATGHFPHAEDPDRFLVLLRDFLDTTTPSTVGQADLAADLRAQLDGTHDDHESFAIA